MNLRNFLIALLLGAFSLNANAGAVAPKKTLKPFANEKAFLSYLQDLKKLQPQRTYEDAYKMDAAAAAEPTPQAPPALASAEVARSSISDKEAKSDDITNVQTQGVDEGDIVKKRGDYLIILRRGRLFTVKVNASTLKAVSTVNAYAPDVNPSGTWYDEMLISGNTVVVIGYSYERGGTEIGLFNLNQNGVLKYRNTYHLRSNDYYSSRNYASRLIGNQLIFYTPMHFNAYGDINDSMPAVRQWYKGAGPKDFKRILPATRIYQTNQEINPEDISLHTVNICDLAAAGMSCRSTAVLGPSGRVFYVSQDAVYVWVSPWNGSDKKANQSSIFRMPLNGSAPTAIKASGSPIDQLSFLQKDGYLNVLVSAEAAGDAMWRAEGKAGDLAMLRVNLNAFGDGTGATKGANYKGLPSLENAWGMQNRFVGDWFLYGATGDSNKTKKAYVHRYASNDRVQRINLSHDVQRIEVMGNDAIVVGNQNQNLKFTSIALARAGAVTAASTYTQANAVQGDNRTHGFFYRADDANQGVVGLPILYQEKRRDAAAVLFLKNNALKLSALGKLNSKFNSNVDDGCQASCVDWYGNARPIFIGDRAYALLGYELVEGRIEANAIKTLRRINFAPNAGTQIAN
jgi:Beta propeller domain